MWVLILFLLDVFAFFYVSYQIYIESSVTYPPNVDPVFLYALAEMVIIPIGAAIFFVGEVPEKFSAFCHQTKDNIIILRGKTMEILQKFKNFFFNKRDRRFIKLGIVDNENNPSQEGQKIYNLWRFNKDRDEFDKEVAQKMEEKNNG